MADEFSWEKIGSFLWELAAKVPLWVLAVITSLTCYASLFIPALAVPAKYQWEIRSIAVFSTISIPFLGAIQYISRRHILHARRRFHITPDPVRSFIHPAKQTDGSICTQVHLSFLVKNRTKEYVTLTDARLIKPKISGDVLTVMVNVQDENSNYSGQYSISPGNILKGTAMIMIQGACRKKGTIPVSIAIADDEGTEQIVKTRIKIN